MVVGGGVILRLFYDGILFNGIHSSVKYYENSLVMIEVNIFSLVMRGSIIALVILHQMLHQMTNTNVL